MHPMPDRRSQPTMHHMLLTGSGLIDAERAFDRAARGRRRSALMGRLRGRRPERLEVFDERCAQHPRAGLALREIPLDAIRGTL